MMSPQPSNKDCTKRRPYPGEPWVEVFKQDEDRTLTATEPEKVAGPAPGPVAVDVKICELMPTGKTAGESHASALISEES